MMNNIQSNRISLWSRTNSFLFEARSPNPELAFHEGIIRRVGFWGTVVTGVSLIASRTLFSAYAWTLVSFPTVLLLMLSLMVVAEALVFLGLVVGSGAMLVGSIFGGVALLTLISGYWTPITVEAVFISLVIASVVLPRRWVVWAGIVLTLIVVAVTNSPLMGTIDVKATMEGLSPGLHTFNTVLGIVFTSALIIVLLNENYKRYVREQRAKEQLAVANTKLAEANTQLARTNEALAVAKAEAETANRLKTEFLNTVTHDLRTPLNAILGYTGLMLKGDIDIKDPAKVGRAVGFVNQNSEILLAMVNDLLDLAAIEAGKLSMNLGLVDVRALVENLKPGLDTLAQQKKLSLQCTFATDFPATLTTDSKRMAQIINNLAGNSIKFTNAGSVEISFSVPDREHWRLKVIDTGIGMPDGADKYIFEPFRQVEGGDRRQYQGTGLGLAITKRLVDKLNGSISMTSQLGKGSTFEVTFVLLPEARPVETLAVAPAH